MFFFASDNSNVEWSFSSFNNSGDKQYVVSTSHQPDKEKNVTNMPQYDKFDLTYKLHSHPGPNGTKGASQAYGMGDMPNIIDIYNNWVGSGRDYNSFPKHGVYHKELKTIFFYTPWKKSFKEPSFK